MNRGGVEMYRFDTGNVPARERSSYWQEAVCDTFVPLECRPHHKPSFSGLLLIHPFADLSIVDVTASAQTVVRNQQRISRSSDEFVLVSLALEGQSIIVQGGREATLGTGNFAIYDTRSPYELHFDDAFRHVVVQIPRLAMQQRLAKLDLLTAIPLSRTPALERITFDFLLALTQLSEHEESRQLHLQEQALDLLAMSLADRVQRAVPNHSRSTALLFRIKEHIHSYLGDSELSLQRVASHFGVTPRYINSLLQLEGSSFGRFVMAARLQRCARAMAKAELADKQISQIAYQWGFTDMSYFSRVFKMRYERSPREFRNEHQIAVKPE